MCGGKRKDVERINLENHVKNLKKADVVEKPKDLVEKIKNLAENPNHVKIADAEHVKE